MTLNKKIGLLALTVLPSAAFAVPPDFTTLTAAADFSTASAAILVVLAALAGVAIVWKGGRMILRALGM